MKLNKKYIILESSGLLRSESLLKKLKTFLKKHNIPQDSIILFGSIVLGLHNLRDPNDLDIAIKEQYFNQLRKDNKDKCNMYCAQIDIGDLSFIHEKAVPKIKNKNIFDLPEKFFIKKDGIKIISNVTWKTMKKHDDKIHREKDKKYFNKLK